MFGWIVRSVVDENGAVTAEAWLVTGVLLMGSIAALLGLAERATDAMHLAAHHRQVLATVFDLFVWR